MDMKAAQQEVGSFGEAAGHLLYYPQDRQAGG
jgi:hypothetical protein